MTDATNPTAAERAVATLRAERAITLHELAGLTDADLATRIEWRGGTRLRVDPYGTVRVSIAAAGQAPVGGWQSPGNPG